MLPPQVQDKPYFLFDVGMNEGFTSLYFANQPNCKHVYGFELIESTFRKADTNFRLNPHLHSKISAHNYGLYESDGEVGVMYQEGKDYSSHITETNEQTAKAIVKKSSSVLGNILNDTKDNSSYQILKIDVEGSEYAIFKDLYENDIINQFDVILGEYHNGIAGLEPYLSNFYFDFIETKGKNTMGVFVLINKNLVRN